MIIKLLKPGDGMGEPHIEGRVMAKELNDFADQLVLLVLQHIGKLDFIFQITEIELGNHLVIDSVVKTIDR